MKHYFLTPFILLCLFQICYSQTTSYRNEFGFRTENDSFLALKQDQYYTNGLSIYFRSATDQRKLKKNLNKVIWEVEAGQKMYNAYSGYVETLEKIDRPFAAYLYAGGGLQFLYHNENSLKISLQLGTIGPDAKGKEVQELLHNSIGFYEIKGWEWQVENEVGINSSMQFNYLLSRSKSQKSDFTVNSYVNLGNTLSGLGAGMTFRAGALNSLFNSAVNQSTLQNHSDTESQTNREFFFYARPMIHFVAYDATIQGGLFREAKGPVTFDRKPFVFSQQVGFMYSKHRWTADFSLIFKSREVRSTAKAHQYGSFALYYKFN